VVKVVADNTVLSNFALTAREDLLHKLFGDAMAATDAVMDELSAGEAKGIVPRRDWSWLPVLRLESPAERQSFETLRERLGRGEASCLSLAISRRLRVLTDDRDTRIIAHRRDIPVSGTIGVLVLAVKRGLLPLDEANTLLSDMIEKGYYAPYHEIDALL